MSAPARSRTALALAFALVVALGATRALAQPAGDPVATAQAREHFALGVRAAREERWDEAIRELQLARSLGPTPSVEFNLGVAYRAVGRARDAIAALERFLATAGPSAEPARVAQARAYLDELRASLATLVVRVAPSDARLTLDGAPADLRAGGGAVVDPGRHILVAEAPGYRADTRVVQLAPGARTDLEVRLAPVARAARVRVTSSVRAATIRVDGRAIGRGAAEEAVSAGRHVIEVRAEGFAPFRRELIAVPGGDVHVHAELIDRRPVTARPWFWVVTGVVGAAVVGGLVAGGVVLFSTTDPEYNGTLGHVRNALTARP